MAKCGVKAGSHRGAYASKASDPFSPEDEAWISARVAESPLALKEHVRAIVESVCVARNTSRYLSIAMKERSLTVDEMKVAAVMAKRISDCLQSIGVLDKKTDTGVF